MARLIYIFIYYFILTPISVLAKIFGTLFLIKRFDRSEQSYWNRRKAPFSNKEDYHGQF